MGNTEINETGNNSAFSDVIDKIMKDRGINLKAFSETTGIDYQLLSKIKSSSVGTKKPLTLNNALVIAQKFHVSLDYIYGLSENPGDDAANILSVCDKIFNLDYEEGRKAYKINVQSDVKNMLVEIHKINQLYKSGDLPDDIRSGWIERVKTKFNEKIKNEPSCQMDEYYLTQPKIVLAGVTVSNPPQKGCY